MAQSDACMTGDQEVAGLISARSSNFILMEIGNEILSMIILSRILIPERPLPVSGAGMCTNTG